MHAFVHYTFYLLSCSYLLHDSRVDDVLRLLFFIQYVDRVDRLTTVFVLFYLNNTITTIAELVRNSNSLCRQH